MTHYKRLAKLSLGKGGACLLGFSKGQLAIAAQHHLNLPDLFFIERGCRLMMHGIDHTLTGEHRIW